MEGSFANPRFIRDPISICNYARPVEPKQLDEGIDDTLVSVDATRGVGPSTSVFSRLASWADVAMVTDPQSSLVGPGKASINSSSSTQSSAASVACSGPNNSVTALMKALIPALR